MFHNRYMTYRQRLIIGSLGLLLGLAIFAIYTHSRHQPSAPTGKMISQTRKKSTLKPANNNVAVHEAPAAAPLLRSNLPSQILNLTNWKLTVPVDIDHSGDADEIRQPALATFTNGAYFRVNDAGDGVLFEANAAGATTKGSHYPRSELREMNNSGRDKASWSSTLGTHTMVVKEAITHLPVVKPEVVAAQIHDDSYYVILIRLEGQHLFVEGDGKNIGDLNSSYSLGTVFTVRIVAEAGRIKVFYNDGLKVDYAKSGSGYYYKAGCYTQTNTARGDAAEAYGQVAIYALSVTHS